LLKEGKNAFVEVDPDRFKPAVELWERDEEREEQQEEGRGRRGEGGKKRKHAEKQRGTKKHPLVDGREPEAKRVNAAVLEDADAYDADYFDVTDGEMGRMDPHHRLALEVACQAFHNAGYDKAALAGQRVGVFVAMSNKEWSNVCPPPGGAPAAIMNSTSSVAAHAAHRISQFFNLRGPSIVVDSGCASSLAAVDMAVQSLKAGRCSSALVVGVHLLLDANNVNVWEDCGLLSTRGAGRFFGNDSDGFALGEGAGAVVLENVADAARHRQKVLVKVGASVVGYGGSPFEAHREEMDAARTALMVEAREEAGLVEPKEGGREGGRGLIAYAEISGSGRTVDDLLEAVIVQSVYGGGREEGVEGGGEDVTNASSLVVGCVKDNLGHMDGASGMAGLLKTILVLQHRQVPPQPGTKKGVHVEFGQEGVRVASKAGGGKGLVTLLPSKEGQPVRATVTSNSWSGTNAHVLLEEVLPGGGEGQVVGEGEEEEGMLRRKKLPALTFNRRSFPWWYVRLPPPPPEQDDEEEEEEEKGVEEDGSEATHAPPTNKKAKQAQANEAKAEARRAQLRAIKDAEIKALLHNFSKRARREHDMEDFLAAVRRRDVETVEMWFDNDYEITKHGLIVGVLTGDLKMVKLLLDRGGGTQYALAKLPKDMGEDLPRTVTEEHRGAGLMHLAVMQNLPEMVDLLYPYMKAEYARQFGPKHVWHAGAIKDHRGFTPLHLALSVSKWQCIESLIQAEHKMEDPDQGGHVPLLWLQRDGFECLEVMLREGADVNAVDWRGRTVLFWFQTSHANEKVVGRCEYNRIMCKLVEKGADHGPVMKQEMKVDLSTGVEGFGIPVIIPKKGGEGVGGGKELGGGGGSAVKRKGKDKRRMAAGRYMEGEEEEQEEEEEEEETQGDMMEVGDIVGLADGRRSSSPTTDASASSSRAPSPAADAATAAAATEAIAAAAVDDDAYDGPPEGRPYYPVFAYIKECVGNPPATGCKGCDCHGACATNPNCACRMRSQDGLSYYTPEGLLKNMTGMSPIECGPNCQCNDDCGLRVSQHSVAIACEVRWTGKRRGWGVFTREALRKGQYAMTYVGEIMNEAQANARFQEVSDKGGNPNYQTEVQITSSSTITIDANYGGNVSRLINHSCDGNLFLKKIWCGLTFPKACFFATRDIPAGSELNFNYNPHKKKRRVTSTSADHSQEEMRCHCGAKNCRDVI
jgi:3-oxoacyl-(acyl-carrier-protein) synthase